MSSVEKMTLFSEMKDANKSNTSSKKGKMQTKVTHLERYQVGLI